MAGDSRPATRTSLPWSIRGVLRAIAGPPEAQGRGARAKPVVVRSHAVARRAALGAEAVGLLEPAICALRAVQHLTRAVALPAGKIALGVPVTAHGSYRRSGGKRTTLPSPRRYRRRSRRTPLRPRRRGDTGSRGKSSAPPRCRHDPRSMGARRALDFSVAMRCLLVVRAPGSCNSRGATSLSDT
jgi:hypothetical protein